MAEEAPQDIAGEGAKGAVNHWDVLTPESNEKPWSQKTGGEKGLTVAILFAKFLTVCLALYLFIISLGLMGSAFKILGGPTAGQVFRNSEIFDNPFAGLVLGVLATVLVQSSSTSTSIIISMTAAGLMEVKNAIPMIMGSNIGTSVTNTIVSIAQIGNKDQYRRAFAGATVHDCFNLLTVSVLLPVEAVTGLLRHLAKALVEMFGITNDQDKEDKVDFLKKLTKPVTSRMIALDKKLVTSVAEEKDEDKLKELLEQSMIVQKRTYDTHLFMDTPMDDATAGTILLVTSLMLLSTCLIVLVKVLQSIFRGRAAIWMKSLLNLEFKSVPFVADYILILFGIGITILMQSSSITTSTLTPLVGIGLIKLEKMFPFTVGANIGTTVTGILSALASSDIYVGMQVALAHLLFNLFGTLIWFPIPAMRAVPIGMSKVLGNLAADKKWFPIAYIFVVFGAIPLLLLGLSMAGDAVFAFVFCLLLLLTIGVFVVLFLRLKNPTKLPPALSSDPAWMPNSLRVNRLEEESGAVADENADNVGKAGWWQGTAAWSLGLWLLIALVLAIPNNQWGHIKYANFDPRDHIGIGTFSVCSAIYEEETKWAQKPGPCDGAVLADCAGDLAGCSTSGFSDEYGSNEAYEGAWLNCSSSCTTVQWGDYCKSLSCSGGLHEEQCENVTEAVGRNPDTVEYTYAEEPGVAWKGGNHCRDVSTLCDNDGQLGAAGTFAWLGFAAMIVGQVCLVAYAMFGSSASVKPTLPGSLACFGLAWILTLISWVIFMAALGGDATCTLIDQHRGGAVYAKGKLSDIINGGSYSFGIVVGSWILLTFVLAILVHKVVMNAKGEPAPSETRA